MSLLSMTGYGRGEASGNGVRVEVEINSVNRRQLDICLNLPREMRPLDPWIQEEIHKAVTRGRVTVDVSVTYLGARKTSGVRVDAELAAVYLGALRKTAKRFGLKADASERLLLDLPGVVRFEQPDVPAAAMRSVARKALVGAMAGLMRMRGREGAELEKDLLRRMGVLESALQRIEKRAPEVARRYRRLLAERLREAGAPASGADERVLREVALYADRCDISEETTRLKSHIKQARQMMTGGEPAGRSLDFMAQEMFREINTIGSKAGDAMIAGDVVRFKAELERIREQVQNIE